MFNGNRIFASLLAFAATLLACACQPPLSGRAHGEKPIVDQTIRLNSAHPKAHVQVVPRRVKHQGGMVAGTFDLVVESGNQRHIVDLGALIGFGQGDTLTFPDKPGHLVVQDLNHDGTKDVNILHAQHDFALVSFDAQAKPLRLKFDGASDGGYASPKDAGKLISTTKLELTTTGFRWSEEHSRPSASWNKQLQLFEIDI